MADSEDGRLVRPVRFGQYYRVTTKDGLCYRLPASLYNHVLDEIETVIKSHHWHADGECGHGAVPVGDESG